ncbi:MULTISPECIES: ABC transporter substrate-binding protein [unclassified Bradyrhizobium]|uniref:ABC transporter substrate-binding protein n=1 Tax=unclassified Bradyrhizobium TaxID=2631580 RepID=UPI001FF9EFCB|nr:MULTISPECIES: ABC transporter substrate-binding protein [unclassified Bradyrhizobium]MCK1348708.1 ABC transporter substrate-binding protein [Bradyrhizobium sp. CW11]MCK1700404.1 ABC transporter substrate-binding protein [Bradyrhizobium sp. 146]
MMMKDRVGGLHRGLTRRSFVESAAALLSMPFVARASAAWAQEKLAGSGEVVVFSYGGSYTQAVRKYVYEPFTKATGIAVVDVTADIAEPQVRAMTRAGRVDWDVALIDGQNYPAMHEAGLLQPIDYSLWDDEALKGTPQSARLSDAVVAFRSTTLLAYDARSFPKTGPQNWADFWDVKAFPGPRGLSGVARHMVFALAADGVPNSDRWPLTDDKVERALKKLSEIKPNVAKWWTAGGEPVQALINREFVMTSCYDGRAVSAIRQGAPIRMVWSGGNLVYVYWTALKGGPNSGNAQKLVAFLNRAQNAAGFTLGTNLTGPNVNQLKHLPADLVPLLSITEENASQLVAQDDAWLAAKRPDGKTNIDHLQERWLAWRAQ